jgi:hypothetical protein
MHRLKKCFSMQMSAYGQLNVAVMMAPSSDRGAPLRYTAFLFKVLGVVCICLGSAESACRRTG